MAQELLTAEQVAELRGAITFARQTKSYTLCDIEIGTFRSLLNEMPAGEEIEITVDLLDRLVTTAEATRTESK